MRSRQRSLEQERANRAWQCVQEVKDRRGEYRALARGAPADIQTNGLGQTLAFWRAKGNSEHLQLLEHVSAWLHTRLDLRARPDIVKWIATEASSDDYRRATVETMAFLGWVKRFAEAELAPPDSQQGAPQ